jgi:hypothetical protein
MTIHARVHATLKDGPITTRQIMLLTRMPTASVERCLLELRDLCLADTVSGLDGEYWVAK